MLATALAGLARNLPVGKRRLDELLDDWHIYDWQSDPFSRGAYSYVPVGGLQASRQLAEPVTNTLFFAGEATHDRLNGTVAGAIVTGFRVAEEVLQSRNRACIHG